MDKRVSSQVTQPVFARPSLATRIEFALAAVVASTALLGGELSLS